MQYLAIQDSYADSPYYQVICESEQEMLELEKEALDVGLSTKRCRLDTAESARKFLSQFRGEA